MSIKTKLTSNSLYSIYKFRKILLLYINELNDSNHSSTFTFLDVAAFRKQEERKRQRQQAKQTHSLLLSIVVFVYESYLFYASYI